MSDKDGVSVGQYEGRSTRKGHCKRFWWVYLVVSVIIVAIVVPIIILVAVPKIAQGKINDAKLSIQGITVSNTQSNSYTMQINSTIETDGKTHATVDAFDGVMYLEDLQPHTPFATVSFPATDASIAVQGVNVSQASQITDMAAFTTFNTWLLSNTTLRVTVEGETNVHVAGISSRSYPVTFKKTIEMPGLQQFNGTTVSNSNISVLGFGDGTNFKGTTTIPNRSLVTFEIGNATFHNYLLGEEIGTVFIDNMTLRPGLNQFPMRANISQLPVITTISEEPYCQNGVLPFELRGKDVVNNGQVLTYFRDALAAANQSVPIDLTAPLTAIGLPPHCNNA